MSQRKKKKNLPEQKMLLGDSQADRRSICSAAQESTSPLPLLRCTERCHSSIFNNSDTGSEPDFKAGSFLSFPCASVLTHLLSDGPALLRTPAEEEGESKMGTKK